MEMEGEPRGDCEKQAKRISNINSMEKLRGEELMEVKGK